MKRSFEVSGYAIDQGGPFHEYHFVCFWPGYVDVKVLKDESGHESYWVDEKPIPITTELHPLSPYYLEGKVARLRREKGSLNKKRQTDLRTIHQLREDNERLRRQMRELRLHQVFDAQLELNIDPPGNWDDYPFSAN